MTGTAAEQILSRVAGRTVAAGDVIHPRPDLVTLHDYFLVEAARMLDDFGVDALAAPERVLFCTDHEPLAVSAASAERQKRNLNLCRRYEIGHAFGPGRGGHGHIFPMELGLVVPGDFVLGYDLHTPNFGAIGALGFYLGPELVEVLACGSTWIEVPETVLVRLSGTMSPGVVARDIAQWLLGKIGAEEMDDAVVEYQGPLLDTLGLDGRMTLCNAPLEGSARSAFITPSEALVQWARGRSDRRIEAVRSDSRARYRHCFEFDISKLEPQVAAPPSPDNIGPVTEYEGRPIQHAFIGSCANGGLSDLRTAAHLLRGRQVHPDVRLVITPGTQEIAAAAAAEGLLGLFTSAGAMLTPPGCGVCAIGLIAPLSTGETSINTGTANEYGRLGASEADIYLASPLTVAASAVSGCITDPRRLHPLGEAAG